MVLISDIQWIDELIEQLKSQLEVWIVDFDINMNLF